ncbi:lytic murein transglycosylase B [Orrella sp. 11846]|uniref:lytic murein transglycosylase B n=1 Tax=Orrella sp. 11846 TaxID=3409913 RepID=UPI003B59B45B
MSHLAKTCQLLCITALMTGCATAVPPVQTPAEQPKAVIAETIKTATPTTAPAKLAAKPEQSLQVGFLARPDVQTFYRSVVAERQLPEQPVAQLLSEAQYDETARRLMTPRPDGRGPIIRDWPTYRKRFVEPIRIERGRAFMQAHAQTLMQAEKKYGVPASIIAAIIGIETLYGQHMGNHKVLDTVTTLAFDYPEHPKRAQRVELFQTQLADLLELHVKGKLNAHTQLGSFAGAIGLGQFMPTSIKEYAVSAQPPRAIDLEHNLDDAIFSVANFLRQHGWVPGAPVFAPVTLPADAGKLVTGGLEPTLTWSDLEHAGATASNSQIPAASWQSLPLGVIDLPTARTGYVQYLVATPNFFALTQYNRSYFYATSVAQLAQEIR